MKNEIISAAKQCTANRYGLKQISKELHNLLLNAERQGVLQLTRHNNNYCSLQGVWSTPAELIRHASHFEMIEADTIMLKQGGTKMRAFKIAEA